MTTTETKATHTQGEWRAVAGIDEWLVMSPQSLSPIARIGKQTQALEYGTNRLTAEEEANARLIAASPDLLKACQELLEICRWKCSPSDEVVLSNGKSNHQAMIDAEAIVSAAVEARNPDLTA